MMVMDPDPNDPPETWLDRTARAAMAIIAPAMDQGYWTPGDDPNRDISEASYQLAAAMLAEKRRRKKKEEEE